MGTERDADELLFSRINFLMRLLVNLNAGALFALCIWLSWAAMDYNSRFSQDATVMQSGGCGCRLSEMNNGPERLDVASRQ